MNPIEASPNNGARQSRDAAAAWRKRAEDAQDRLRRARVMASNPETMTPADVARLSRLLWSGGPRRAYE